MTEYANLLKTPLKLKMRNGELLNVRFGPSGICSNPSIRLEDENGTTVDASLTITHIDTVIPFRNGFFISGYKRWDQKNQGVICYYYPSPENNTSLDVVDFEKFDYPVQEMILLRGGERAKIAAHDGHKLWALVIDEVEEDGHIHPYLDMISLIKSAETITSIRETEPSQVEYTIGSVTASFLAIDCKSSY